MIAESDAGRDELAKDKAKNANLEAELGELQKKVQFIAVDAILHARVELMGEFNRGKHANWDPDLGEEGGYAG